MRGDIQTLELRHSPESDSDSISQSHEMIEVYTLKGKLHDDLASKNVKVNIKQPLKTSLGFKS